MLFKLSNLNSNLALNLGYLNPALNNSVLVVVNASGVKEPCLTSSTLLAHILFLSLLCWG